MTHTPDIVSSSIPSDKIGNLIHADLMFFDQDTYFISSDDKSNYIIAYRLESKESDSIMEAIKRVKSDYHVRGFKIKEFRTDSEAVFIGCTEEISDLGIIHSLSPPENYESSIERMIRTIKEKVRSIIFGLDYNLPTILYRYVIQYVVDCHNAVTNKKIPGSTPSEAVLGRKLDVKRHCRAAFGDIGMFRVPYANKKDTNKRSQAGVVVGRETNSNGLLYVWLPSTNKVVKRFKFKRIDLFDEIKDAIENGYEYRTIREIDDDDNDDESIEEAFLDPFIEIDHSDDDFDDLDIDPISVNMSVIEALNFNKSKSEEAIKAELQQLIDLKVFFQHIFVIFQLLIERESFLVR